MDNLHVYNTMQQSVNSTSVPVNILILYLIKFRYQVISSPLIRRREIKWKQTM